MFVCNYKCINEREEGTTTTQLWSDKLCFQTRACTRRQRDGPILQRDYHGHVFVYFLGFFLF